MPKFIDLTDMEFNRWKVLYRAPNKGREVYWTCQCQCGTIKDVKGAHLRTGKSQSCGCLHKEQSAKILQQVGQQNKKDLTGQFFGLWEVIQDSGKRSSNGSIIWTCRCQCGTIRDLELRYLTQNISTHCGCQNILSKGEEKIIELLTKANIPFETQKTFEDCRFNDSDRLAKFDFWVNNEYLIEYDGIQHFEVIGWNTLEKLQQVQQRDAFKTDWCKKHNIPLIRIPYTKYETLTLNDLLLTRGDNQ